MTAFAVKRLTGLVGFAPIFPRIIVHFDFDKVT